MCKKSHFYFSDGQWTTWNYKKKFSACNVEFLQFDKIRHNHKITYRYLCKMLQYLGLQEWKELRKQINKTIVID